MKKNNNKGFTLIELLAVIVILAVLVLIALPRVIDLMEQSRKNAFKVEVQKLIQEVETIYADQSIRGGVVTLNIDNKSVRYMCMTLDEIYQNNYMSKDYKNSGYTGIVEVFVPATGGAVYGVNVSNGFYSVELATSTKLAQDSAYDAIESKTSVINTCKTVDGKKTFTYSMAQYNSAALSISS